MAPPTATICARCGATANSATASSAAGNSAAGSGATGSGATGTSQLGGCARCGARADLRPAGPPSVARCPVCGTAAVPGRTTCAGCGLLIPGTSAPEAVATPVRRWAPWQVVLAAVALVATTAAVVTLLGRSGPPGLGERWRVALESPAAAPAVVAGDVAVVATDDGTLVGIDALGGTPRWRFLVEQRVTAPVAAAGELAVLATTGPDGTGLVFAVDLRTGEERWRVVTDVPVTEAPALDADAVYVSQGDASAHDLVTGEQLWRHEIEGGAGPSVAALGTLVVATADGVVALSTDHGEERWSSGGGRPEAPPGVVGDLVVVGDGTGSVVARSLDRGQERWRVGVGGPLLQPVVAGPEVAVAVTAGGLVALDVVDGTERWEAGPTGDERLRAASDGTTVAVATGSGILLVDGLTGEVVASARRSPGASGDAHPPALADGVPIVVDEDEVAALSPRRR